MRKKVYAHPVLLLLTFISPKLEAQTIESSINLYGANFPQEKIYIHFDKEAYLPGETIWFKAYLFEENLPSDRSTNFYAALYDEQGRMLKQLVSPVFGSTSSGQFDIPDSIKSSQLICRAYTTWMMNFDTSLLFSKPIRLLGNDRASQAGNVRTAALHFFPEGGSVIEGVRNTIAFKANFDNGLPFEVNGVIKKQETGEVLVPLTSTHDGMGRFDLDIEPGSKYYAEWTDQKGNTMQTWIPEAQKTGISLKLTVQKDKLFYNLINKTGSDSLHVLMYMYQKIFYRNNLVVLPGEPFTAAVPLSTLPSGVAQLTVFDANWQPVAERIAFVDNKNYRITSQVNTKSVNMQKRGRNELEIEVMDTIPANMSLSITDADMNAAETANSIISGLLLQGDIRGYIHNPAYYFTDTAGAAQKAALDLVMMTHGWRRYNWNIMAAQKMPEIKSAVDEYLGVYGQVGKEMLEKMDPNEQVNLIVKTIDSTNTFYSLKPDKAGLLKQTNLVFYDSARVYFSFNKNKENNKQIAFSKFNFTYPAMYSIQNAGSLLTPDTAGTLLTAAQAVFKYHNSNNGIKTFNEEKTLEGVTVKSGGWRNWKNDPLLKMDEKYASGMFIGGSLGYSLDVVHDEKSWTKIDIYNYIRGTIPGLIIGNFNLTSGRSLAYRDKSVLVYIDEHEMTTSDLESLSLSQVAYIKFIPNFMGKGADAGGGSMNPALSVYTRKGDDLIDRRPTDKDLGSVKIAGYTPVKEFYSPDYSQTNANAGTDARSTLLWMPYVLTDAKTRRIPVVFYNNDFTRRFRVVLEGINEEGKMLHIEKIIQ